jgi:hypothetical protein
VAEKAKKIHGHQSLLIDIGSASVGAALMTEHKTGVPELSHVKRMPIGTGSEEGKAVLPETMKTALSALLKEYASLMKHGTVRVVLAAPWHHAKIRTIQATDEKKPIQVSMRSVERLIEKYKNEAPPAAGHADLEAVAVQVRVNGYPTSLTHPVEGTTVKVNLYESEVDVAVKIAIGETVAKELPGTSASFHSFPLVAGTALRVVTPENNFSFADIGGEITDLGVIHGDGIHFLASFPVGFQTIARTMTGGADNAARLAVYARGELSPEEAATTEAAFATAFKAWIGACEDALKVGSEEVPIPRTLFVMSDKEALAWVAKGITSYGTMRIAPAPVEPALFQKFVAVGDEGIYDVFLALSAIFFHTSVAEVVGENAPVRP